MHNHPAISNELYKSKSKTIRHMKGVFSFLLVHKQEWYKVVIGNLMRANYRKMLAGTIMPYVLMVPFT